VDSCSHSGGGAGRQSDERLASELASRLAVEFPTVDPGLIFAVIVGSLDRTRLARVQNYRLVLAERETRAELRRVVSGSDDGDIVDTRGGRREQRVDG
jgi:hypothetical protein